MIQNGITNFVNMLDNIMIGQVGTPEMTGVAITNQLIYVFSLCSFGAVSGAGILGAQFAGKNDHQGVRYTFRYKLLFGAVIAFVGIAVFLFGGKFLVNMYMQGDSGITNPALTMKSSLEYLRIMVIGLVPFVVVQCYASTLREIGHPKLPMVAGLIAVLFNLVGNYILIFGHFGAPALGVRGAALATVISRFVEMAVVIIATHTQTKKYIFAKGAFRSLYIPSILVKQLFLKSLPLIANEGLWSAGVTAVNIQYSLRGLDAVAAGNISQTFWNVFAIAYITVGAGIGIILGQLLGADKIEEAKESSYKLITFSFLVSVCFGSVYFLAAEFIPNFYNTDQSIRSLATTLMQIAAITMPFDAICHSSYFVIRSGGKMAITFIFDSGFMWLGNVLLAFILCRYTTMPFVWVYLLVHLLALAKGIAGIIMVRNGFWARNITKQASQG
ncbi:MAG: MATE family efflux transporter [Clostridia bacterium]|nr:MATE family efflux transporter [Clostridia bacterium]